jgi:hypothetical protein
VRPAAATARPADFSPLAASGFQAAPSDLASGLFRYNKGFKRESGENEFFIYIFYVEQVRQ